jgi:predicted phosphodiesterase
MKTKGPILVIPDLHMPFAHKDHIRFLAGLKAEYEPSLVIQLGDIVDQHTLGRWSPELDSKGANEELAAARVQLKKLAKLFPEMQLTFGNHDTRVLKRFKDMRIPGEFLKGIHAVYGMPDTWKFHDMLEVNGILFFHGDGFSGKDAALRAAERYRQSCVIGHTHSYAGVQYSAGPRDRIFGANSGCLIDQKALAFQYAKNTPSKGVLGATIIEDGVPFFLPM